ncbi:MAG: ATP-binding protein [Bacteroides sp.]|nr:ATP-binding protein [Bacteroides sp.]
MSENIILIDNSSLSASNIERNRIYTTLKNRILDFQERTGVNLKYKIILNPSKKDLLYCEPIKDNLFFKLDGIQINEINEYGMLRSKIALFRFDATGIQNILIQIQRSNAEDDNICEANICNSIDSTKYSISLQLFGDNIHKIISIANLSSNKLGICLIGDNLACADYFVKGLSERINYTITQLSINDVLKDNTTLRKAFNDRQKGILFFKEFDFLFSDLNTSPKIPNRELSMLRNDLLFGLVNNVSKVIVLNVESPLIISKDISNWFSCVIDITTHAISDLRNLLKNIFPNSAEIDSLVPILHELPNWHIFNALNCIRINLNTNKCFDVLKYLEIYTDNIKKTQSEFLKVEGADFKISTPNILLDRVVMSEDNRRKLNMALSSIINEDLVYNVWGFSEIDSNVRTIINFFGPPGTGKTLCANAIARELSVRTGRDFQLLSLNYSEIESMYVGEAPKKLERVFNFAKDKDLVLFFDEADSFLGKRIQNVSQGSEQAINSLRSTMLIQLEKYTGVVIFATNLTTNYDSAFKTRFLAEIEFPLPNKEICKEIFLKNIPSRLYNNLEPDTFGTDNLNKLAEVLLGLSGRDIKTIIWRSLLNASQKDGKNHLFVIDDFIAEGNEYKREKSTDNKDVNLSNITTSVTPASQELSRRLGLQDIEKNKLSC